jgi:hypothetical protein
MMGRRTSLEPLMNPSVSAHTDEEYSLPPIEALLAGTLALMTGCAQHSGPLCQRELMVGKVVSNLSELSRHPALSPSMHVMLGRLNARWLMELGSAELPAAGLMPMPEHRTLQ